VKTAPDNSQRMVPPHSIEAERAALGAALKDPQAMSRVAEVIEGESDFYDLKNRAVYSAAMHLYATDQPVDITTVVDRLNSTDRLEAAGRRTYVVELAEGVATTCNAGKHAELVHEYAIRRRLLQAANAIGTSCFDPELSVEQLLEAAESGVFTVGEKFSGGKEIALSGAVASAVNRIEEYQSGQAQARVVYTGFPDIDRITGGFAPGNLVVLAARPSMGKTALAMNIAENVALDAGKSVGVLSLEMSRDEIALRMLCGLAKVPSDQLRSEGKLSVPPPSSVRPRWSSTMIVR
jgi:replicative DNA helicase